MRITRFGSVLITPLILIVMLVDSAAVAQEIPAVDRRASETRHLNMTFSFPGYRTKEEWLERAEQLRRQILVSTGLWPTPPKGDLNARVFGRIDRGDHTVEKVYFESFPGLYVTGNLYRPKNRTGKIPAVLCPHGHWSYGRLENTALNSGPARAANLARQGYVAFAYDMIGYNDSIAINHRYGGEREALWGISVLGLQLWNSIRAVDFMLSLPEVDAERLACTGESGGGTQTFLLTAVDDRIRVAAPVNMISAHMQGGDLCENAPNLRIDTYNVEIGAMMAPRPLLMVSATGDWTKNTPHVEYPDVRSIYRLFGAEDKVQTVQIDAPHNYNRESREAVYGWFSHWLLGRAETDPIRETSSTVEPLPNLLVFFGLTRPQNELDEKSLTEFLIGMARRQLAEAQPRDQSGLKRFREEFGTALRYSLMAEYPRPGEVIASAPETSRTARGVEERVIISRRGRGDRVPIKILRPAHTRPAKSFVLLVSSPNAAHSIKPEQLIEAGHHVMSLEAPAVGNEKQANETKYFTTYNRTDDANRVQDVLTALAYLNGRRERARISVVGMGEAGLWALLARGLAPAVDRMVVDAAQFDNTSDEAFLQSLPIPGVRRAGDFSTAAIVAPLTPLLIHNTGGKFRTDWINEIYRTLGRDAEFRAVDHQLGAAELIGWLTAGR